MLSLQNAVVFRLSPLLTCRTLRLNPSAHLPGLHDRPEYRGRRGLGQEMGPGELHVRQSHVPLLREQTRGHGVHQLRERPPEGHARLGLRELHVREARPRPEPHADRHEEAPEGVLPNPLHEPGPPGPRVRRCQILTRLHEIKHVRL
jgi:hypothetical protein